MACMKVTVVRAAVELVACPVYVMMSSGICDEQCYICDEQCYMCDEQCYI